MTLAMIDEVPEQMCTFPVVLATVTEQPVRNRSILVGNVMWFRAKKKLNLILETVLVKKECLSEKGAALPEPRLEA